MVMSQVTNLHNCRLRDFLCFELFFGCKTQTRFIRVKINGQPSKKVKLSIDVLKGSRTREYIKIAPFFCFKLLNSVKNDLIAALVGVSFKYFPFVDCKNELWFSYDIFV